MTAGDYTVEFDISKSAYENWYHNEYKKSGGEYE